MIQQEYVVIEGIDINVKTIRRGDRFRMEDNQALGPYKRMVCLPHRRKTGE
jgi:hypothetical protein